MHITDGVLAPLRARYGEPAVLWWEGGISDRSGAPSRSSWAPLRKRLLTEDPRLLALPRRLHDAALAALAAVTLP